MTKILTTYGIFEEERKQLTNEILLKNPAINAEKLNEIFFDGIAKDLIKELHINYKLYTQKSTILNPPNLKSIIENSFKNSLEKNIDKIIGSNKCEQKNIIDQFLKNIVKKIAKTHNYLIAITNEYENTYQTWQRLLNPKSIGKSQNIVSHSLFHEDAMNNTQELLNRLAARSPLWAEHLKYFEEVTAYVDYTKYKTKNIFFQDLVMNQRKANSKLLNSQL